MQQGEIERGIGPAPEDAVGFAMGAQQLAGAMGGWPIRAASPSASMPYCTARTHCLNSSRSIACVCLLASDGTARACLAKLKYGSPDL